MTTGTTTGTTTVPAAVVARARVDRVERLSPAFVRVALTAPEFADLDDPGLDTRIKLGFPAPDGGLPDLGCHGADWFDAWLAVPTASRPPLRTYTIRDVRIREGRPVLVVDLVVHEEDPATLGPACRWALAARPGDRLLVVAPRIGAAWGGTEFDPGGRRRLLLAGDETAVPALTRILAAADPAWQGTAFIEVPGRADVLDLPAPAGVTVTWVPRDGAPYGRVLVSAVREHLGLGPIVPGAAPVPEPVPEPAPDTGLDVWETPLFSSSGEDLADPVAPPADRGLDATYAWIAGESWPVRALRRSLVTELGMPRAQVAFMGYWREGVAMRS